jgi:CheY-like chemotaxis protein
LLFGDPALTLKIPLPRRPAGLAAHVVDKTVSLSWQAATDYYGQDVDGYNLYRSTSASGIYRLLNSELITDTEFEDPTAQIGVTYYYVVSAVDEDADESVQSASVSALIGDAEASEDILTMMPCFIATTAESNSHKAMGLWVLMFISLAIMVRHTIQTVQGTRRNQKIKKINPFHELKKAKTLLVDDDEFIRNSLELAFKTKGCCLRVAESAEEGLEAINAEQFDIIICDFRLPGMNGLDFLKLATVTQPQAVSILITAYRDEYMFSDAIRMGVTEFIDKPFSVKALVALLALSLKRQTKNRRIG